MTNNQEVNSGFGGRSGSAFVRIPPRNRPPPPPPRPRSPIPSPSISTYSVPNTTYTTASGILTHNNNQRARSSQARFNAIHSNFDNYLENIRQRMLANRVERTAGRNINEQNLINYIKSRYPQARIPQDADFMRLINQLWRAAGHR